MEEGNIILLGDLSESNIKLPDPDLYKFYQDLKNRVLWLDSEINEDSLMIIRYILQWNQEDVGKPLDLRKPIKLMINSVGGSLDIADSIVSIIELSKTPVWGIGIGMVASAASLIYLACHKRFALKTTYFIFHKGSYTGGSANYNELMAAMDDYKKQVERMVQFYITHTGYEETEVKGKIETDWYIRGQELVEKGVIDEFISDIDTLL